ncbi:hypothetical protein CA13_29240 [Planctomycetes bacterium CA13]|uniref:Uncharacterized protein n=1 Tax=Novipirellula herctigrandis TaxID=2527986 RepID=A0A5C5Z3Q9_9BACT|nr:hypothetical protein CA13_29240 [Planctomycetes bacterium CA13]
MDVLHARMIHIISLSHNRDVNARALVKALTCSDALGYYEIGSISLLTKLIVRRCPALAVVFSVALAILGNAIVSGAEGN